MTGVQRLDFDSPDETRTPAKTRVDLVRVGNTTVGRFAFEPGWRWSECIKPVVGTERCQARHVGIVQSGAMHVVHDDGTEADVKAGDAYVIEPGHMRGSPAMSRSWGSSSSRGRRRCTRASSDQTAHRAGIARSTLSISSR